MAYNSSYERLFGKKPEVEKMKDEFSEEYKDSIFHTTLDKLEEYKRGEGFDREIGEKAIKTLRSFIYPNPVSKEHSLYDFALMEEAFKQFTSEKPHILISGSPTVKDYIKILAKSTYILKKLKKGKNPTDEEMKLLENIIRRFTRTLDLNLNLDSRRRILELEGEYYLKGGY